MQTEVTEPNPTTARDFLQDSCQSTRILRSEVLLGCEASTETKANEQQDARGMQTSLFEKPLRPLTPPELVFGYKYTSAGGPHTNTLQDWEVQTAYLVYLKALRTREEALRMLAEEYGERIPARHPHFIMGIMKLHPRTLILIGLLRAGVDSGELASGAHCSEPPLSHNR